MIKTGAKVVNFSTPITGRIVTAWGDKFYIVRWHNNKSTIELECRLLPVDGCLELVQ